MVDEGAELGVREWLFAGGGEPMVRGDLILEMCTKIRERGMNGALQSNGSCFKPEQLQQLVRLGWDMVSISIDGPDSATNDAIRCKGAFEKATRAARELTELKRKHRTDRPQLCVPMVVTSLNYDKVEAMVDLVHELGGDRLRVNNLVVFDERQMAGLIPKQEQEAAFPQFAARALARANALGLETNLSHCLEGFRAARSATAPAPEAGPQTPASPSEPLPFSQVMCFEPWLTAVFTSHGKVSPCCVFWEPSADSIREKSLREVWLGPYATQVRRLMREGNPPSYCARCTAALLSE